MRYTTILLHRVTLHNGTLHNGKAIIKGYSVTSDTAFQNNTRYSTDITKRCSYKGVHVIKWCMYQNGTCNKMVPVTKRYTVINRYVAERYVTKRYSIISVKYLKAHLHLQGRPTPLKYVQLRGLPAPTRYCTPTVQLPQLGRATSTRNIYVNLRGTASPSK